MVECMHLAFPRLPGESYHRQFCSLLLYLCEIFYGPINSLSLLIERERSVPLSACGFVNK